MAAKQNKTEQKQDADLLEKVARNFEAYFDATIDSRAEAEEARDYFDGKQWTDEEIATLKARKQPVVTDNKLKDKIEYLVGLEAAQRTDPKAYPRTPQDQDSAEAATDALRYVAENNDLDTVVSDIAENLLIEGDGGSEVVITKGKRGPEVLIKRDPWDRRYYDPHSMEKDFSDANYLGTFVWMDAADAEEKWPDLDWSGIDTQGTQSGTDTEDDKPKCRWFDPKRHRVRIVEQWYRKGSDWYYCKFIKGQWVEKPAISPYQDDMGGTEHPYAWMSCYVDRDGNRYGVVKRYKSLQDEINHRRSRALHILNTKRVIAEEGAVTNINKARQEVQKPDGFVEITPGMRFDIEADAELAMGQFQILADAQQSLATTSPKAVSNMSASQSGRAKQLENQADAIEVGRIFDQIRALKRQIYRKIWNRVQQFWTDEKWVRVRDDEGRPKYAALNQEVTNAMLLQEAMEAGQPVSPEMAMIAQTMPNQVVDKRNNLAELDVDIILDDAPDVLTVQQEEFANLVNLASAGVVFPPEIYVEASSLRNKEQLLEKLRGEDNPQMRQAMAERDQIAKAAEIAEIEESRAKARKSDADAENKELENMAAKAALIDLAR